MNERVIGRLAPSPTGRMHLGNIYSFLMAWLSVRKCGGRLILRIEDLDEQRCRPEYADQLLRDLETLCIDYDEGPVYQSGRKELYDHYFSVLQEQGNIFPCFCNRAEIHALSAPHASDNAVIHLCPCADWSEEKQAEARKTKPPSFRIRVPEESVSFHDLHYGEMKYDLRRDCGDFVIRRADGFYAYQFAVVVDDMDMHITEVCRGRDLLSSTANQIYLFSCLNAKLPQYFHLPMLLSADGRRLSKRDRDLDLGILLQTCSPEDLFGRIANLSGLLEKEEAISLSDLLSVYDRDRIKKDDISLY